MLVGFNRPWPWPELGSFRERLKVGLESLRPSRKNQAIEPNMKTLFAFNRNPEDHPRFSDKALRQKSAFVLLFSFSSLAVRLKLGFAPFKFQRR
jgi:hypothetical protein